MAPRTGSNVGLMFQAFWGARAEDAASVAARVLDSLQALDGFRRARDGRWVDSDALTVPIDLEFIEKLVSRSIPVSVDGKTFPGRGFMFLLALVPGAASPHESRESLYLEIHAGSGLASKHSLANSVIVDTASQFPEQETFALWPAAFDDLVDAWRPDHAALLTREQRQLNQRAHPDEIDVPWIGAITYLSRRVGRPPQTDAVADIEDTPDGTVLRLSPSSPGDALAVAAVKRVVEQAESDGWNARIPSVYGAAGA